MKKTEMAVFVRCITLVVVSNVENRKTGESAASSERHANGGRHSQEKVQIGESELKIGRVPLRLQLGEVRGEHQRAGDRS